MLALALLELLLVLALLVWDLLMGSSLANSLASPITADWGVRGEKVSLYQETPSQSNSPQGEGSSITVRSRFTDGQQISAVDHLRGLVLFIIQIKAGTGRSLIQMC